MHIRTLTTSCMPTMTRNMVLTQAPTVQRLSRRLLVAICEFDQHLELLTRDVSQAYVQVETTTQRSIAIRIPATINPHYDNLLRVDCLLYGVPESAPHWYRNYHNHHRDRLGLEAAVHDSCLLFVKHGMKNEKGSPSVGREFICLQTGDTANEGNKPFVKLEFQNFIKV